MEHLGEQHQPDLCSEDCTAQHDFFFIRVQPSHSHSVKAGRSRRRRLDLKVDLSPTHNVTMNNEQLLQLNHSELQVSSHSLLHSIDFGLLDMSLATDTSIGTCVFSESLVHSDGTLSLSGCLMHPQQAS